MKKRMLRGIAILLVLVLAAGAAGFVLAESGDPALVYDGAAHAFSVEAATPFAGNRHENLFPAFQNVMPGDTLTQTIRLKTKNLSCDAVSIRLKTEPVQDGEAEDAAQANADYEKLLESPYVTLEVYVDGVLKDRESLAEGVLLGDLRSGTTISISVKLVVAPEAGNELQALCGMVDWVFTAEERNNPAPPSGAELLAKDKHVAYVIGYPDGEVKPGKDITRAEVATIFFRLLTDEARASYWSKTNAFRDVAYDKWYNNAISTMANAGIVTGYPDGTFRPDEPITRAEFAAIASRFNKAQQTAHCGFTDVEKSYWAYDEIALAEQLGWVNGYPDGTFRPKQDITRAEVMTLTNRMLERAVEQEHMLSGMHTWPDNTTDHWFYEAVQEATNSHTYTRLSKRVPELSFCYEDWKTLLAAPDWAALEEQWSEANSK